MMAGSANALQKGARRLGALLLAIALPVCAAFGGAAHANDAPSTPAEVVSAKGLKGFVTTERLPSPKDPILIRGKVVWGSDCQNCHGGDPLVGAPKITSERKWAKRIAQGLPTLFEHAKEGFLGPTYKEMPAKGGNPDLTDDEVEAAVALMVWTSGGVAEVEAWLAAR